METIYFEFINNMLHEILLALLGLTGSIIIEAPDDNQGLNGLGQLDKSESEFRDLMRVIKFVVNPDLRFLSIAERDQINKVIKLGALFKMI